MSTYVVLFKYTKYVLNKQNYFYKKEKRDLHLFLSWDTRIRTLAPTAKMLCATTTPYPKSILSSNLRYM